MSVRATVNCGGAMKRALHSPERQRILTETAEFERSERRRVARAIIYGLAIGVVLLIGTLVVAGWLAP